MELPQHVQAAFGIASPATEEDVAASGNACRLAEATFGLSGVEFAAAASRMTSAVWRFSVTVARHAPPSWKYSEFVLEDGVQCLCVCTPEKTLDFPPTAASDLLLGAWFSDPTLL